MPIFKSHLYTLPAYKPPLEGRDPHQHMLLDFNERTMPVSEPVKQALIDYINDNRLQMYPAYGDIVPRLARYAGVSDDQMMITNGSDQGIELVFRASCSAGDEVIIPAPSFAMYSQCAQIENVYIHTPHYTKEGGLPVDEMIACVNEKTRVICIANPNNPSGTGAAKADIERIAQAAPNASILVDECYFEYSQLAVVDLIDRYDNIVITRTFSKTWGMPSLRFGYLMSSASNVEALLSVRGPYDINQLAVVAAHAALDNPEYTEKYVDEVMNSTKPQLEAYLEAKGIDFWPSQANYVWAFPDEPQKVADFLVSKHILVRPKADLDGKVGLRITIGVQEQMDKLIAALDEVLA